MTSWDEVKRHLAGSRDALQASTAKFAAVDAAQLAADLKLKERATAAQPAVIGLDAVERDIVADIQRRARIAHGEYNAALDVYEKEPEIHPALMTLENVLLVPHLASATTETRTAMADLAVTNALAVLNGKPAVTPVT